MGITYLVFDMRQNIRSSEEISELIDRVIIVGTKVPKTRGGTRPVTKIDDSVGKIQMRTGVKTKTRRYITKEMILWAYEKIQSGEKFKAKDLKKEFPDKCKQGDCVFSMTGGILVLLGTAEYSPTLHAYIPCIE